MAATQETVIIAEDDPTTLRKLSQVFATANFKVLPYKNKTTLKKCGSGSGTPCVLILGDKMGVEFMAYLRQLHWEMPVIFLHSGCSISEAVQAIQSGADDYLPKPFCPDTLLKSVTRAMIKARRRAEEILARKNLAHSAAALTEREYQVINLILAGMLNKQIAGHLQLALATVKYHRGSAMRKLGARTAAELARIAREIGIAQTPP